MDEKAYVLKIKKMSDTEILSEFRNVFLTRNSHFVGLGRIEELIEKHSLFQRKMGDSYKNLSELGSKIIELCNEYQAKYNHLVFELETIRFRDIKYLEKAIKKNLIDN